MKHSKFFAGKVHNSRHERKKLRGLYLREKYRLEIGDASTVKMESLGMDFIESLWPKKSYEVDGKLIVSP